MILKKHPNEPFGAENLKAIGYWRSKSEPDLPDPKDYIGNKTNLTSNGRKVIAKYLDAYGNAKVHWRGWSNCRICGKYNGTRCMSDGVYIWPEGFGHYILEHDLNPPPEFYRYVFEKIAKKLGVG